MPQMSPYNWTYLMMLFYAIYLMIIVNMYFTKLYKSPKIKKNFFPQSLMFNFKW